jgi:hypothetical protein
MAKIQKNVELINFLSSWAITPSNAPPSPDDLPNLAEGGGVQGLSWRKMMMIKWLLSLVLLVAGVKMLVTV